MENFGAILRKKREEKNITLETASRDTVISKQYLTALENENIDVFPGHTYVTGFLRNYSDYLGTDTEYLLKLFRGKVIQEAPIPEELIIKRHLSRTWWIVIISASATVFALLTFLIVYFTVIKPKSQQLSSADLGKEKKQSYTLSSIPFQRRLYKGDFIKVPSADGPVTLTVSQTVNALAFDTPIGTQFVELGEELEMDVDGKGGSDIVVFLSDISKADENLGAEVRMFAKAGKAASADENVVSAGSVSLESGEVLKEGTKQVVILQDNRAYPFAVNASFRGVCLYRYKSDRNDAAENFFISGDTLKMQAQNTLRLWISNANTVKMQLIADGKSYDLEMGHPGQVSVQDIRWIKEANGVYKLTVAEVD
ncbi:helix-turn-helix domain-containing protein [Treponema lecithinolyticum]|uniref:helix-turn-helix domain-containing protein n=1 Tax=Treponema lecithinolyticum TaxID=53418 RepID=UPI0028E88E00|nr:helix-turn-helix domain-containing protein [Treponema lecithinolyticum]